MLPLYRFLARWIPRLPRRLTYTLADVVGAAVYYGHRSTREAVAHNQQRALGSSASRAAVATSTRRALQNLTRTYVDEFRLPAMHADDIKAAVTINGLEFLEAARTKGKGVILASAHYGAPHIVGQLLAILGYPTTVVVEHVQPEALFEFITAQRSSHGLNLIPIDKPLIGLIRTLRKENGVVGLVVDRDVTGTGLLLPFMGETTRVADGAVQLARRTGSAIVVAFCRRIANHRYEAFILPELDVSNLPEDDAEATRVGTMRLMQQLETFIRTDPSQWIMTTPLWK